MKLTSFKQMSRGGKAPLVLAAVGVLALASVACSKASDPTPGATATQESSVGLNSNNQQVSLSSGLPANIPVSDLRLGGSASIAPIYSPDGTSQQMGIWITGYGTADVAADVANVYIGVESRETTVSDARQKAADAMTAVLDTIRGLGIEDDDIVTTSFNIYPQQTWIDVTDSLGKHSEPRIIGYVVSNQVQVTVKNIDLLDEVVDAAAEQGGDLIRVNSISFSVADPAAYGVETRKAAAADAKAKAELYAEAMGVHLGDLLYLTEIGSSSPLNSPVPSARAEYAADGASFTSTPIQSGDISLSTTIQAAFAIVP